MKIQFTKYHGTGNDFIMVDCTSYQKEDFVLTNEQIGFLCHRRFGIGADGLILIFKHPDLDFEIVYFNSDGSKSFCGNGARCAVKFAQSLNLFCDTCSFMAIDGVHSASIHEDLVSLKMSNVSSLKIEDNNYIIHTGSPHFIRFTSCLENENIVQYGKEIRYSDTYKKDGINVNIVEELSPNKVQMLTYERGVEDETYSCGTGATAVALAVADKNKSSYFDVIINVKGGQLRVTGERDGDTFHSIYLIGPAEKVFIGEINL
ncbi:MAG: diaminopimelate epimerase [Brumimicrobium sp.]|nr:diaminopimelate epimerase [Brumimicrobium sp.]MCO5269108.1 diaminopimelate epimerase [Brumimicrobium sp.]